MSELNLYQRMNAIMLDVGKISKDKFVQLNSNGAGYKAVTHDNVTGTIRPYIVKHGVYVAVDQTSCSVDSFDVVKKGYKGAPDYTVKEYIATVNVELTFINIDNPNEKISSRGFAYAIDSSDKAPGKALSYAVKNVLLKNFMLESCDDEEERSFEKRHQADSTVSVKTGTISSTSEPSEKQMKMIFAITKSLNPDIPSDEINKRMANIKTGRQASEAIERLQAQQKDKR